MCRTKEAGISILENYKRLILRSLQNRHGEILKNLDSLVSKVLKGESLKIRLMSSEAYQRQGNS